MSRTKARRRPQARSARSKRTKAKPSDPFAGVKPLSDVSILLGGLPDDRSAEEILADLRARHRPRPSA